MVLSIELTSRAACHQYMERIELSSDYAQGVQFQQQHSSRTSYYQDKQIKSIQGCHCHHSSAHQCLIRLICVATFASPDDVDSGFLITEPFVLSITCILQKIVVKADLVGKTCMRDILSVAATLQGTTTHPSICLPIKQCNVPSCRCMPFQVPTDLKLALH